MTTVDATIESLGDQVRPIRGDRDYDELVASAGAAQLVLLGEGTHGTREFYRERARLTQRLILEHGFQAVAVEADWPDAFRLNRFVLGLGSGSGWAAGTGSGSGSDSNATQALGDFQRFPTWMWRNTEVRDFADWLADHNRARRARVGFFGLDLYSMYRSIDAVLRYLDRHDVEAARVAREHYACFDHCSRDTERYARYTASGRISCADEVLDELKALLALGASWRAQHPGEDEVELFSAEQNARLVKNAEEYYRSLLAGRVQTWNLRDQHMLETLSSVCDFLERGGREPKVVVWAHNSHLGDARATDMAKVGELNLGQLVRERFPKRSFSVGFTTFTGTVTAAADWDLPGQSRNLQPALPDSWEARFHDLGLPHFALLLDKAALHERRIQRAVGVVYRPQSERLSHYFTADLAQQFDAVVHIDRTSSLEPLRGVECHEPGDSPETFPFADDAGA